MCRRGRDRECGRQLCSLLAREQCAIFDLARIGSSLSGQAVLFFALRFPFLVLGQRNVPASALNRIKKSHVRSQLRSRLPPPHSTTTVRFTVLHSIAYEINRICRCLVLTGSNTIDKDYVCLYTPESVSSVCVCIPLCACSAY